VTRILIAEDSARVASFLEKGLKAAGYLTTVSHDGVQTATMARDEDFDLLILDLGLPGLDGFAVLEAIRSRGERIPVLVLTARQHVTDTVAALEHGADDYLTKPFSFDELDARVRARMRADAGATDATELRVGGVRLDLQTRTASADGASVTLTSKEFLMLETFMRHPGEALSREDLVSHVWGYQADIASNAVDVYVGYLRRKLGADRFEAIRGFGYVMPG